jgi:hypothetical protein
MTDFFIFKGYDMKSLIALIALAVSSISFAAEPAKKEEAKAPAKVEANCVTKDKNGKCPPAPKSEKPTPKKVEAKKTDADKKADAPKAAASAPAPAAKASEPAKK